MSKKKIRCFVKKYLPVKLIGGRIFTEREALESLLRKPRQRTVPSDINVFRRDINIYS